MKICNMCGNKVNDNVNICPICGNHNLTIDNQASQQLINNGMHYNHQNAAYSQQNNINVQQQYNPQQNVYNNMNQGYNPQQNVYNNMNQGYNQQMNNQLYQPVQSNTKTSDKVGAVISTIGIYYSLNILLVLHRGLEIFINEQLSDPKYAEMRNDPGVMAFSITWVALFAGIISLIIGLKNKKYYKNKVNLFNIIGGLASLIVAVGSMMYIYNYLS